MDFRGVVFDQVLRLRVTISVLRGNLYVLLYSKLNKVKLGKNITFYGKPILQRYPYSKMIIGNDNRFRSDLTVALGYKYRCILRTRTKEAKITIGDNCGFNATVISACESITIGNNVKIGFNSTIIDYDGHSVYNHNKSGNVKPVEIKEGVFIGMNVTILKGVTIGKNSVIGANSIVTKDIPPNVVAAGNPCKVLKNKG